MKTLRWSPFSLSLCTVLECGTFLLGALKTIMLQANIGGGIAVVAYWKYFGLFMLQALLRYRHTEICHNSKTYWVLQAQSTFIAWKEHTPCPFRWKMEVVDFDYLYFYTNQQISLFNFRLKAAFLHESIVIQLRTLFKEILFCTLLLEWAELMLVIGRVSLKGSLNILRSHIQG